MSIDADNQTDATLDAPPLRFRARATREEIEARLRLHDRTVDELLAEIGDQVDPPIGEHIEAVRNWIRQDAHAFTLDVFRADPGRHSTEGRAAVRVPAPMIAKKGKGPAA